jgi:hypothetical protein
VTKEVIDVPMSGRSLAKSELVVTVDPAKATGSEGAAGVGVDSGRKLVLTESADLDRCRGAQFDAERVRSASHDD